MYRSLIAAALAIIPVLAQTNATVNNYSGLSPTQRGNINATQAQAVISAAAEKASSIVPQNIAVVDPSGTLVAFLRMDSAYPGSIDISQKKARTVALFNGAMTTAQWYNGSQPGGPVYGIEQTNGGLVVFGGGLPIIVDGVFIGAVGVSGGSVDQDVEVATAGVEAVGGYLAGS